MSATSSALKMIFSFTPSTLVVSFGCLERLDLHNVLMAELFLAFKKCAEKVKMAEKVIFFWICLVQRRLCRHFRSPT